MAVIYTISHPFTNDIVYVGVSRSLSKRVAAHVNSKNGSPISEWVKNLINNFTIPKIEVLENCDHDDVYFLEGYWISQLTAWGFNLFNKNKNLSKPKKVKKYIDKTGKVKVVYVPKKDRKSKKWTINDIEIGATHRFLKEKRAVYVIYFRQCCIKYSLETRHLQIVEDGEYLVGTVIDKADIVYKNNGFTKNGRKRYYTVLNKPKVERRQKGVKFKYGFDAAKIGDTISFHVSKFESFKVSLRGYNERHETKLNCKYVFDESSSLLTVTYIPFGEISKSPYIPVSLTRLGKGRGKLTQEQILEIQNSNEKVRILSLRYDVSETTIYKTQHKTQSPCEN